MQIVQRWIVQTVYCVVKHVLQITTLVPVDV
jgi:hypothetical protein